MFRNISLPCIGTIILASLLSSVGSIPVRGNSRNIKCIAESLLPSMSPDNFPRRNSQSAAGGSTKIEELPGRGLFNLDESAIATLSKLANLRLLNFAAYQQEQRRISIPKVEKIAPLESAKKILNFSWPMISSQKSRVGSDEVHEKNDSSIKVPEKLEFNPRKFHCHPIEDVFVPAIDKMVPAYFCKLESRQFILSSERFLEDYKYHLDVTVDEMTFHRLLIPDDRSTGNSMASVIPVTLTQRRGDEIYGVKRTQN